jgi:hypothetical protein
LYRILELNRNGYGSEPGDKKMPSASATLKSKDLLEAALSSTMALTDQQIHELRELPEYRGLEAPEKLHIEQGYFGILDDPSVRFNNKIKQYELRYYSSDDATEHRWVALREISTDRSETDIIHKISISLFHSFLVLATTMVPYSTHLIKFLAGALTQPLLGLASADTLALVGLVVLAFFFGILFAVMRLWIENHLVVSGSVWSNSITQISTYGNVATQMLGANKVLLKLRQFIKWRRFVNFFMWIAGTISVGAIIGSLFWHQARIGYFEFGSILVFSVGVWLHMNWLWNLRVRHTTWRDPTTQISIMIVRMHQRYVENKAGGFKFGGGGGTTSDKEASNRPRANE